MVVYSINDLEKLSGVKAHTIRVWEKRYGLLNPQRTKTNIRYYQDSDLQTLLNVAFLNKKGLKISKICQFEKDEIKRKIAELTDVHQDFEDQLDVLMLAMFEFDEYNFNKILDHKISQTGFQRTMMEVIYPLLDKLSMMWIAGSVKNVHESFISQIIRRKTIQAIEELGNKKQYDTSKYIIYLPENENHELILLFLQFLLKKNNYQVLNIGLGISLTDLQDACLAYKPDYIFTLINDDMSSASLQAYMQGVLNIDDHLHFILSGFQATKHRIQDSYRCSVISSLSNVIEFIQEKAVLSNTG
jgi:DNA-binding transcriptional MerR regulator